MHAVYIILAILAFLILGLAIFDLCQRKHAILRSFPLIGHLRYLLEAIGPELRQYIVTDNDSERPFSPVKKKNSPAPRNLIFDFGYSPRGFARADG